MNLAAVEKIADAVLYEGYVLYPYRASAAKNRQRWNFGGLFPKAYSDAQRGSDAWSMQTECLVHGDAPTVDIKVRFLQVTIREAGRLTSSEQESSNGNEPEYTVVDSVVVDGKTIHTWQEAIERDVFLEGFSLSDIGLFPVKCEFTFLADRKLEIHHGDYKEGDAIIVRRRQRIDGTVEISAEAVAERLFRLSVLIHNDTPLDNQAAATRDEAALFAMASTHTILACRDGAFVSLMDPPDEWRGIAAGCKNVGAWPVLVGDEPQRDFLLASPIILYDYPQIAPESAGDLCDGLEIDEILHLRIMSLTDEEKEEMRSLDDRTRAILERTENLPPDQLAKLHGAVRGLRQLQGETP
jgi:hydrogenase maturation protease